MYKLSEKLEFLKSCSLFQTLPYEELKPIALTCDEIICRQGDVLFNRGDEAFEAYVVIEGKAEAFRLIESGDEVVLAHFHEGDIFGEFAILSNIPRTASVRVIEDFKGLKIEKETFIEIIKSFPEVSIRITDVLVRRLLQVENRLLDVMNERKPKK